jgi:hypothetical protein
MDLKYLLEGEVSDQKRLSERKQARADVVYWPISAFSLQRTPKLHTHLAIVLLWSTAHNNIFAE